MMCITVDSPTAVGQHSLSLVYSKFEQSHQNNLRPFLSKEFAKEFDTPLSKEFAKEFETLSSKEFEAPKLFN